MDTPVDHLLTLSPAILQQLTTELVRRGDQCLIDNPESQLSACFLLALRSLSIIKGMAVMLGPEMRDSYEVLSRAHLD